MKREGFSLMSSNKGFYFFFFFFSVGVIEMQGNETTFCTFQRVGISDFDQNDERCVCYYLLF